MSNFFMRHNAIYTVYALDAFDSVCVCAGLKSSFSVRDNSNDTIPSLIWIWVCRKLFVWHTFILHDDFHFIYFLHTETHFFPLHNFQHTVKNLHWNVKWKERRRDEWKQKRRTRCRNCTHLMHHKTQACKKRPRRRMTIIKDCEFIVHLAEYSTCQIIERCDEMRMWCDEMRWPFSKAIPFSCKNDFMHHATIIIHTLHQ